MSGHICSLLHNRRAWVAGTALLIALLGPALAQAITPDAKTVPWVSNNPLEPHDAISGEAHILKGTSSVQGANIQFTWDFGDGSAVATGTVTNAYVIEAPHAYTAPVGTVFTARLTVRDTNVGGGSDSAFYYVEIRAKNLQSEVNIAIDKGLWHLHKYMTRTGTPETGDGNWVSGSVGNGNPAMDAANVTAFLVNGHLESGDSANPYTETVKRGMRHLFTTLNAVAISNQTYPAPIGTVNPDSNGNGLGIQVNAGYPPYQGGLVMDAIVATGAPSAVATTGGANILGRTYKDIVQDMADMYAYGQGHSGAFYGGWRYSWHYGYPDTDNSTNQWAAIGLIGAERGFVIPIPSFVKDANLHSILITQDALGRFGYTNNTAPAWSYFAVTPSGLVQLVMDGLGRGDLMPGYSYSPWDRAETFLRDNFCNSGDWNTSIRSYYYGLFSFTKAMLLHDPASGPASPITMLESKTPGVAPIDWYGAEITGGAPCNGVARTLVAAQTTAGYWYGHNVEGNQMLMETGFAIIMLNRTVFESGVPVAVATATPNPAVAFQTITLSGAASFHKDPARTITSWAWDKDNNGTFETNGVTTTISFPAVGDYPRKLKVCDDGSPQVCAETTVVIRVSTPPLAPTADAGGPYNFCANRTPYFLDGTGSINPDNGQSEPGSPPDSITAYAWDLDGDSDFNDASGAQPNVTTSFPIPGAFLVQLRVTDNTALSFPSSGQPNLSDTDSSQVIVRAATDPACGCISNLMARPKLTKVQLTWTYAALPAGGKYNVYRATVSGGPYLKIGETTSTYSTYLDGGPLALNNAYYYMVRPANAALTELCQSNEARATPVAR